MLFFHRPEAAFTTRRKAEAGVTVPVRDHQWFELVTSTLRKYGVRANEWRYGDDEYTRDAARDPHEELDEAETRWPKSSGGCLANVTVGSSWMGSAL